MENISIGLSQDFIVDRLIRNARVRRNRSGYATYIDNQHYGISDDMLEIKWEIVLDKANSTLQSTT